ncbi:MAG: DsbA family protein [Anaerolineae bacterium]|nr:DsbA family protein [Anaerolineae bacterium]
MGKREELRARRRRDTVLQWMIPGAIALIGLVILGGILIYNSRGSSVSVIVPNTVVRPNAVETTAGDPNAPVKVVALEDFQCPYCGIYSTETEPKIMDKYVSTGKVYYKFVPFSFLGAESIAAAEAAYCAMDQNKFWEYHDYLYANQAGENKGGFNNARLESFADSLKLDMNTFKGCLSSHKYTQRVQDDAKFASQSGATGSPFFLVNNKLVDVNALESTIEAALAGK